MKQNQIIILAITVIVVLGGLVVWALVQIQKVSFAEDMMMIEGGEGAVEIFSMSAIVLSVDAANNFITVKPVNREEEVRVFIAETTKLIKVEFPFDPADLPAGETFIPIQTEIEISDFKEEDNVFIKAKENIAGKTEFGKVDFIHILP